MSTWITGFADKAESILNKIDKNTAVALQNQTNTPTRQPKQQTNAVSLQLEYDETAEAVSKTTDDLNINLANNTKDTEDKLDNTIYKLSKVVDILTKRQHELEQELSLQTNERNQVMLSLNEAQSENNNYKLQVSELETNIANLQQECSFATQKLQMQIMETDKERHELQDYRAKAQRALQLKDAQLAELKSNKNIATTDDTTAQQSTEITLLQIEFEAVKQELQQTAAQEMSLRQQLDDYISSERQHIDELSAARRMEQQLNKELLQARQQNLSNVTEYNSLKQEINTLQQQLNEQLATTSALKQQLQQQRKESQETTIKTMGNTIIKVNETVYEERLKQLTQTLCERQSTLEHITAERNALRLQLEKVNLQMQDISSKNSQGSQHNVRNVLLLNSTDDVKAQFPQVMHPNPFDNRVARRVKHAYSTLDSAGIRIGAFLRRYPLMRFGLLVYVALLHLWVMFVLLSTTPNN